MPDCSARYVTQRVCLAAKFRCRTGARLDDLNRRSAACAGRSPELERWAGALSSASASKMPTTATRARNSNESIYRPIWSDIKNSVRRTLLALTLPNAYSQICLQHLSLTSAAATSACEKQTNTASPFGAGIWRHIYCDGIIKRTSTRVKCFKTQGPF